MESDEGMLIVELADGIVERHALGELVVERGAILELHLIEVRTIAATDVIDGALQYDLGMVDEGDLLTDLLDRRHVVCREKDGSTLVAQAEDLALELFGIDGIEAGEGFIKDQERRTMDDGGDELHLLGHALGELLDLLVAPLPEVETLEPLPHLLKGIIACHAAQTGEVDDVVLDLHFLIQATFLGEVADVMDVVVGHGTAMHQHLTAVGMGDTIDDADKTGLTRTIGTKKAVDGAVRDIQVHMAQCHMVAVLLADVVNFDKIHKLFFIGTWS